MLFVVTRWIMLATALQHLVPIAETRFDSTPLPRMSDIDTFRSDCKALFWAGNVLYFAQFVGTARKQAYSPLHLFSVFMVHSIFRHTGICYTATKLPIGLRDSASRNCTLSKVDPVQSRQVSSQRDSHVHITAKCEPVT